MDSGHFPINKHDDLVGTKVLDLEFWRIEQSHISKISFLHPGRY
jgi:hypothetical protein